MAEPRRRRSVSAAFLLELLTGQLAQLDPAGGALEVVDLGGGTGGSRPRWPARATGSP